MYENARHSSVSLIQKLPPVGKQPTSADWHSMLPAVELTTTVNWRKLSNININKVHILE